MAYGPGRLDAFGQIFNAIAVQFLPVGEQRRDVVEHIGARRMAGELGNLPRRQSGEDLLGQLALLDLQPRDLVGQIHLAAVADVAQFLDLLVQLADRLLEIQVIRIHRFPS